MTDNKLFVLMKGLKRVCYLAPSQFYNFEGFLNMAINGFLNESKAEQKKAEGVRYTVQTPPNGTSGSASYKPKNVKGYRVVTQSDKKSAKQQMGEIQEELRTRGMHDGENEDGEGS